MPESWRSNIGSIAALLVVAVLSAAGCAQDVGDIDRTQPNKVEKSLLEESGEWYYQQTVVDTTVEGQSGVDVGGRRPRRTQSPLFTAQVSRRLKRVQWEIHEDVLYARSTVEPVEGITEQVDGEDNKELGIVAAFPIKSHFDVQRQYNSQTGEPSNVIVENRSDNPWYDREYMRVDWSTNLVTSNTSVHSGLGLMSPKAAAKTERKVPQQDNQVNPDRARVGKDYIDTVTEYTFNPDMYACTANFGYDSRWRCEGGTARVRNSFWRVDARKEQRVGHDGKIYAPMQYRDAEVLENDDGSAMKQGTVLTQAKFGPAKCTGDVKQNARNEFVRQPEETCRKANFGLFDRFGYFRTNYLEWSEERHTYDSGRNQYANRWNIWETMYDEQGNKISVSEREPEPIVFHLNTAYPKEMFKAKRMVEREWDEAFKEAVRLAKGLDSNEQVASALREAGHPSGKMFQIRKNGCHPGPMAQWQTNAGDTRDADRKDITEIFNRHLDKAQGTSLEEQLWNISIEDRRSLCAELEWATSQRSNESEQFTWQRMGDIRYSFFTWINDFNIGWLGYGPSSADPETGELISADANFAGRALEEITQTTTDLVQYLIHQKYPNSDNGLTRNEIIYGDHVRRQFQDDEEGGDSNTEGQQQGLTADAGTELREPLIDLDRLDEKLEETRTGSGRPQPKDVRLPPREVREAADRQMMAIEKAQTPDTDRLEWYERSDIKEKLMSNPMLEQTVKGMAVEAQGSPDAADRETPRHRAYTNLAAPSLLEKTVENRQRLLRKNNIYSYQSGMQMAEGVALYTGMVDHFKDKSREEIEDYLRQHIFYGTQIHEVGHAVGLRHNFSAHLDALNYHDAFWEIERIKQIGCDNVQKFDVSDVEACEDGILTDEEARAAGGALKEIVDSNRDVDYVNQAEFRLASVMDYTADNAGRFAGLGKYDQAAINFAYAKQVRKWSEDIQFDANHRLTRREGRYTKLPALFEQQDPTAPSLACEPGGEVNAGCLRRGLDKMLNGREWVSLQTAKNNKKEFLQNNADTISAGGGDLEIDRQVQYNFCSDDREGRTLGCETFAWGSNQLEVLEYAFEKFKTLQPLRRYRGADVAAGRSVLGESLINGYARRLLRTLSLADAPFRYFSFYDRLDYNVGQFTADLERAAKRGLNFYGYLMSMPAPRQYCQYSDGDLPIEDDLVGQARSLEDAYIPAETYWDAGELGACPKGERITVPTGPGQFFSYDYTSEYHYRPNRVGTFIDKTLASGRMFALNANFTFSSFVTDQRATNISYWTEFPDALYEFIYGTFMGDYENFGGGCVLENGECTADNYHHWQMLPLDGSSGGAAPQQTMPDDMATIYDPTSFDIRMRLIVNAAFEFSDWEDKQADFSDYMIVAKDESELPVFGDGEEELAEKHRTSFVHPNTGRRFIAVKPPGSERRSITYDLIEWAKELKQDYVDAQEGGAGEDEIETRREAMENVLAKVELILDIRNAMNR